MKVESARLITVNRAAGAAANLSKRSRAAMMMKASRALLFASLKSRNALRERLPLVTRDAGGAASLL